MNTKSFLDLARERYSVRSYQQKPVSREIIDRILEAAAAAPTAVNYQPQMIYVIQDPDLLGRISEVRSLFGAPLAFVVCYDDRLSWKNRKENGKDSGDVDASIVCTHMMLQAAELGIGTCWIGSFNSDEIAGLVSIPSNIHPVAILSAGYPSKESEPSEKHFSSRSVQDFSRIL